MTPLTLDLPPEMHARLSEEAERRNVSESAFVQEIVAKVLADADGGSASADGRLATAPQPRQLSCLEAAGDLVGSVQGPSDLSTNPRYLEEGMTMDMDRWQGRP